MDIGRREYLINTHKYLMPGTYTITRRGKKELMIKIEVFNEEHVEYVSRALEYGCGCPKNGKSLCSTHGRV